MKPCSGDIRHKVLITGDELRELKRHTGSMAEAFGLDRKIEAYQGTRPITLYSHGRTEAGIFLMGLLMNSEENWEKRISIVCRGQVVQPQDA